MNEYDNLDDFIFEYCKGIEFSWENKEHRRRYMGIEFLYNHQYYRMCREFDNEHRKRSERGKPLLYELTLLHCEKLGYPNVDEWEMIGCFEDIYDLLDHGMIEGRPFKDVIMDRNTIILSKD